MNRDFSAQRSGGWGEIREVYTVVTGVRKASILLVLVQKKELRDMKLKEFCVGLTQKSLSIPQLSYVTQYHNGD